MIISLNDHVFLAKILFKNNKSINYDEKYFFEMFKDVFSRIIKYYKIIGKVLIDCYIDDRVGIVIKINNIIPLGDRVDTDITFHFNCIFLVHVDYFYAVDKCNYLYYFDGNFYGDCINFEKFDGELIYDTDEILSRGVKLFMKR